ncbi:SNF2 family N-terminal domain-containing protein [Hypoxylon cercidicola]|nr:SNF2 family N-terminal domain-containing protein [Hypoxylon cercidicola]
MEQQKEPLPKAEVSNNPRPEMGASPYWEELIRENLRTPKKEYLLHGRLDPHRMLKDSAEILRFYSGRAVHPSRIKDNQLFAQWVIDEALREYLPESRFQVTGEIMQGERVTLGKGKTAVPKELIEAIRADGQKEVDAEDPNCPKDTDCEIFQDVGAVAEDIIAASPNSMGPPIEACASYLHMEKCGEYGRNKLTVWKSPLFPNLDGQNGRRGFLDNQLTAIVWIMSRFLGNLPQLSLRIKELWNPKKKRFIQRPETQQQKSNRERLRGPKYFGGILADSMGLGKTLTTIACLDLLVGQALNVKVEDGKPKYRPILILVPNATVATQWVDEIEQVGSRHSIKKILVSGSGSRKKGQQDRVRVLTPREFSRDWPASLNYVWDESKRNAARTVFVISIDAWSRRTCRARKIKKEGEEDEFVSYSTFAEGGRKFSIVVVDEAYKVKNAATGYWKSVALLERQFTLLVTATPCMNMLSDLLGPARLLWQNPDKYLREREIQTWEKIESTFIFLADLERLDDEVSWDNLQLVAGRPSMLTMLIESEGFRGCVRTNIEQTRKYLKYFESLAILRRAPSSNIYYDWDKARHVCLEGLLPNVDNFTVNIQLDYAVEREYQDVHVDLLIQYMDALKNWGKKSDTKSVISTYRHFQIASASLDVFRLEKLFSLNRFGATAAGVLTMRRSSINFTHLAQFLLEPSDREPEVALDYVKLAVRKSPVLRYILHYVRENILERGPNGKIKKLLITEASPILAYYYELVLQFLLVHCRTLHAGLSQEERRELIASFNDDSDTSCQVMIQMYTVGFAGSNLHRNCSQVLVASQAHSLPVQWQTVHRVIRVGQESDVKVVRLKVNNSFHSFRESRQVEKILPELGSRAQGSMNGVLVQLLNLFQFEIDEAWESPEAQKLLQDRNMLLDPHVAPEDGPPGKRIKLEDGTFTETGVADQSSVQPVKISFMPQSTAKRSLDETNDSASFDCASHFQNVDEFLALKTRKDYYEEYKKYPIPLKIAFSNAKNNLRRMLTYGGPDSNRIRRVWTVKDLDNPAVLERAMELMLRVRLGANAVEMLPYPQIDFSLVSEEKREKLEKALGKTDAIDQDLDEAREEADNSRYKTRLEDQAMRGIGRHMTLPQRDQVFEDDIAHGPTNATRKMEREARQNKTSIDGSVSELGSEDVLSREDEEREEVEGADPEHEDDSLNDGSGSGDDNDSPHEEELSPIDSANANTASTVDGTNERDGINDRGDDHDEDMQVTSSRSLNRANAEPSGVKIKAEETDTTTLHSTDTAKNVGRPDQSVGRPDHEPIIKRESPAEGIAPATNSHAGVANHVSDDGRVDIPAARIKEESPERNVPVAAVATHEPTLIEDSEQI